MHIVDPRDLGMLPAYPTRAPAVPLPAKLPSLGAASMTLLRQHGVNNAKDVVERGRDGHGETNRAGATTIPGFGPAKWAMLYGWADAARDEAVVSWSASMSVDQRIEALLAAERAIEADNRKAIDDLEFFLWCEYVGFAKVLVVEGTTPSDEQRLVSTYDRVKRAYEGVGSRWAGESDREVVASWGRREEITYMVGEEARQKVARTQTVMFIGLLLAVAAGAAWFLFYVVWA